MERHNNNYVIVLADSSSFTVEDILCSLQIYYLREQSQAVKLVNDVWESHAPTTAAGNVQNRIGDALICPTFKDGLEKMALLMFINTPRSVSTT